MAGSEEMFKRAADRIGSNSKLRLNTDQKLSLYGLFKQASVGPCNVPKPGLLDMTGRAKWSAWSSLGDLPQDKARELYVQMVKSLDPSWNEHEEAAVKEEAAKPKEEKKSKARKEKTEDESESTSSEGSGAGEESSSDEEDDVRRAYNGGFAFGLCVSTLSGEKEAALSDDVKTIFDWVKEGNTARVSAIVKDAPQVLSERDASGLTLLHWACDRGHQEMVEALLELGADINAKDLDGQSPVDFASMCDHKVLVELLLSKGSQPPSL